MAKELEIAAQFVKRLLLNPALQNLYSLQKEEQILQFLKMNASQLYPTLSSDNFFPGKQLGQIFNLLVTALITIINEVFYPKLEKIVNQNIDLSFIAFFRQQNCPQERCKQDVIAFLKKMLLKPETRRGFTGAFIALEINITDRYIEEIFRRKEYIHIELTKVQRLKMSKEEIKNLVKMSLLLKSAINLLTVSSTSPVQELRTSFVQFQFVEKVFRTMQQQLKTIPDEALKSALNSNLSFLESPNMEATARIAAVLSSRCANYQQFTKIDRGADTPDKSWFNIARRNYKFYGFDIKMIDEFYKISAENGW